MDVVEAPSSSSSSSSSSSTSSSHDEYTLHLNHIPPELLLHILTYLDVPDLLALSRCTQHLRQHSLDPLLHVLRLRLVPTTLSHLLPLRPSLAELMQHRIYVTRTTMAARRLGRSLVSIKLNRRLMGRPSAEVLVERGVLPRECFARGNEHPLAPGLVETKRRIEREKVKDVLRGWVGEWRRRGEMYIGRSGGGGEAKPDVRRIARRFAKRDGDREKEVPWERRTQAREEPARAKVLGLRRFWEGVGRQGVS